MVFKEKYKIYKYKSCDGMHKMCDVIIIYYGYHYGNMQLLNVAMVIGSLPLDPPPSVCHYVTTSILPLLLQLNTN